MISKLILALLVSAVMSENTTFGTLRAIPIESKVDELDEAIEGSYLAIEHDMLVLSDRIALFPFHKSGNLINIRGEKTLGVNFLGQLQLGSRNSRLLRLNQVRGTSRKLLAHDGKYIFEICGNKQIYYGSKCTEPVNVQIVFDTLY